MSLSLFSTFPSYLPPMYISLSSHLKPFPNQGGTQINKHIKWGNFMENWNSLFYVVGWKINFWIAISTKWSHLHDTEISSRNLSYRHTHTNVQYLFDCSIVCNRKKKRKKMCRDSYIHYVACIQWYTTQLFKMRDRFTGSNIKNAFHVLSEEERNLWLVRGRRGGCISYFNFQPRYK